MEEKKLGTLSEIKDTLDSIKLKIGEVEAALEQLISAAAEDAAAGEAAPASEATSPIDLDISDFVPAPVAEPVSEFVEPEPVDIEQEPAAAVQEPSAEKPEPAEQEPEPEPVAEEPEAVEPEPGVEEDLPVFDDPFQETGALEGNTHPEMKSPVDMKSKVLDINEAEAKKEKNSLLDKMTEKMAWRTAIPGLPVNNIISAISLNDRVLFINALFGEDPMAFRDTVSALNGMENLDDAVEYLVAGFPDWNLNSDVVYRFMMAVRRKLR